MEGITIKPEYKLKRVGFKRRLAPLEGREDLIEIAILAIESNDSSLLAMFEKLPALSVLKKRKTDSDLKRNAGVVHNNSG